MYNYYGYIVFLIPVLAIMAWGIRGIVREVYRGKTMTPQSGNDEIKRALEDSAAINKQMLAKLESLETRVAGMEKTLNDIPG